MARRRLKPGQTAWFYTNGSITLDPGVGSQETAFQSIVNFGDVEDNDVLLVREKSEYYLERLIIWFRLDFDSPGNLLGEGQLTNIRVGQVNFEQFELMTEANNYSDPDWGANDFIRIYQEDWFPMPHHRPYVFDGGAVSVSTEATADERAYVSVAPMYKWDLSVKTRMYEAHSIILQLATLNTGNNADFYSVVWMSKSLWRRGK